MENLTEQTEKSKTIFEVLEFCQTEKLPARIVGKWVWIKFDSKPDANVRQALKDIGFRWVNRRQQWAHNCGHVSKPAMSYRPWDKYKTTTLEDYVGKGVQNAAI